MPLSTPTMTMRTPLLLVLLACACSVRSPGGDGRDGGLDYDAAPPPPDPDCPRQPLADTSGATLVGDGTPASCTETALAQAVAQGGRIRFRCGGPRTITLSRTLVLPSDRDTVIDGEDVITLDGNGAVRLLHLNRGDFTRSDPQVTLQRLSLVRGRSQAGAAGDDGSGGAIYLQSGGSLQVLEVSFRDHRAPASGQEVGGGAIFVNGAGEVLVSGASFADNAASNGGALGLRGAGLRVYASSFVGNAATGSGGNPGNGGNGGAVVIDGRGKSVRICNTRFSQNRAGAHGGALFRTGYATEEHLVSRSFFDGNTSTLNGSALYLQGLGVTLSSSTVADGSGGPAIFLADHTDSGQPVPERVELVNDTIVGNQTSGLGAAIFDADIAQGRILNCTIARNHAAFLSAIAGGRNFTMRNTLVAYQTADNAANPNNPLSCGRRDNNTFNNPLAGDGNLQFPEDKGGGFSDLACTGSGTRFGDPLLGTLADNGGPAPTLLPAAMSPARGQGTACPATDQRGRPRPSPCTLGAVELDGP